LASGGILLIAAGFAFSLNTGGLAQTESFTTKPDSVVGLEVMSKHFPAGSGDPTLVVVKQADMAKVAQAVTGTTGVSSVVPTMDPASVMAGKPAIKVVDGWARLELTLDKPADSLEAQAYIPGIREVVHNASETALVGGTTPTSYDIQQTNKRDRDLIIPVALLVIGLILALLLRSIVAPILLIITTVLSFAATLGVCHLVFKNVFHFKATDGSFPLFAFVFLVALGIDYNIFLMTRVREEAKKIGTRPGILKGVTVTGGVITSAGVVLAATFAVLGTLPLVFLAELGFAVAFGVLLDTIVVRSLLVPALSYELDKKIWWPSKLAKVDGADA
jgi:RND superfamily putative drug exporter